MTIMVSAGGGAASHIGEISPHPAKSAAGIFENLAEKQP